MVQLYHIRDCGTYEEPKSYRQFWEVDLLQDEVGGFHVVPAIGRGEVFNKHGEPKRDWDPLFRKPVMVCSFTKDEVTSGAFLHNVREMCVSIKKRLYAQRSSAHRGAVNKMEAISSQIADEQWSMAQKSDQESPIVPMEWAKKDVERMYNKRQCMAEALRKYYVSDWLLRDG